MVKKKNWINQNQFSIKFQKSKLFPQGEKEHLIIDFGFYPQV